MKKQLTLLLMLLLMVVGKVTAIEVTPIANLTNVEVTFTNSAEFANAITTAINNSGVTGNVPAQGINLVIKLGGGASFTAADVATIKNNAPWSKVAGVDLSDIADLQVTQGMFSGWDYFSKIVLPAGAITTTIPASAFQGCRNLIELTVGSETNSFASVTTIEDNAFEGAFNEPRAAKSMLSFAACTSVGTRAFTNTPYLGGVTLGNDVSTISNNAFQNSGIETFPVPATNTALTTIYGNTFQNCDALTTVVIPDGVTTINNEAFENCDNLATFTLGAAVTTMGITATNNCPNLTAFNVVAGNTNFATIDGFLLDYAKTTIIRCPSGKTGQTYLTNDFASVTTIKQNAFNGSKLTKLTFSPAMTTVESYAFTNSDIEEIVINDQLTNVALDAFNDAKDLTKFTGGTGAGANCYTTANGILFKNGANGKIQTLIRVPEGMPQADFSAAMESWPATLSELGASSFRECTHISQVVLPEDIKSFGTHTFTGCTGLTTITLPGSLETFGDAPFQFCSALTTVNIGNNTNFTQCATTGIIYGKNNNNEKTLYLFPAGSPVTKPTIAADTKVIAAEAFAYAAYVQEIKVPQGVHTLEAGCFHACNAHTIIIPHSVTKVANADVFAGCKNLTSIYWLPEKLLGYFYNSNANTWSSNLFYEAKTDQIDVYVSNEYSDTNDNLGTKSLQELYAGARGTVGADKGWGDCKSVQTVYHRALTEDNSADAALGNSGDGQKTNPTYANATSANNYTFLTLYRDFSTDADVDGTAVEPYYTLVLPVSMTEAQVEETFGEGTEIYHFAGREEKVINFNSATTIEAGEPCIIRPTLRATSYMIDLRDTTPMAKVVDDTDNAVGNGKTVASCPITTNDETKNYSYSFKATYQKGAEVPAYAYYVSNNVKKVGEEYCGVVKYLTKKGKFGKGLRGYICCDDETPDATEPAKEMMFMSFNGVADTTTGIAFEGFTANDSNASKGVYTLSGQLVRANGNDLSNLPAGLYLVNGKKTLVK